jgi:hypothetical protein
MNKDIIFCIILAVSIHIMIWFQLNGQLVWGWFKDNVLLMCLMGIPISYGWLTFTRIGYEVFQNLWAIRLIGFATGMISFPIMTWIFMNEGITFKSFVSVILSIIILLIQLY